MASKLDAKRNYIWNAVGVSAQNAMSPLLLVAVTRVNGIHDSGLFSFAFSVAVIFWSIGMWGGRTYQVSDVKDEFFPDSYITVRLLLVPVMLIGAMVFAAANQYGATKTSLIFALVLFKAIESVADSVYGVIQTHDHLFITGRSLTYKAVAGLSLFVAADVLTGNIILSCLVLGAANLLFLLGYDLPHARGLEGGGSVRRRFTSYIREARSVMKRCAPVFAVSFLSMLPVNIPRYFVDKYHPGQIGYFGIIAMPVTLIVLFMTFILLPNVVGMSKLHKAGEHGEFHAVVLRIILITISIGTVILAATFAAGAPILRLIFGVRFEAFRPALLIMVAGGTMSALVAVFCNVLTITRNLKPQFYILLLTNILLAALSAPVVKARGLNGAFDLFAVISLIQIVLLVAIYKKTVLPTEKRRVRTSSLLRREF